MKCCCKVGFLKSHRKCRRYATIQFDGKWYCHQHAKATITADSRLRYEMAVIELRRRFKEKLHTAKIC